MFYFRHTEPGVRSHSCSWSDAVPTTKMSTSWFCSADRNWFDLSCVNLLWMIKGSHGNWQDILCTFQWRFCRQYNKCTLHLLLYFTLNIIKYCLQRSQQRLICFENYWELKATQLQENLYTTKQEKSQTVRQTHKVVIGSVTSKNVSITPRICPHTAWYLYFNPSSKHLK